MASFKGVYGESVAVDKLEDRCVLSIIDGAQRMGATAALSPENRRRLAAALLEGLAKAPIEMAGDVLSVEETDAAIAALKRGESVSFTLRTGPRS